MGSKFLILMTVLAAAAARAGDTEGCLNCHQYRGLARVREDGKTISYFYVDPNYYNQGLGPHTRLRCTDCHERGEVEVFPHQQITPVDCGKACHLEAPGQVEVRFSHERVKKMVEGSVHGGDVLKNSNELLGSPLHIGQSKCLLCHDEPFFSTSSMQWSQREAPVGRCNVCHDEQLPQNTRFSYWHVHARSQPARGQQDIVKVCGLCHANAKIRESYKLPDAIASYLASFHGKAVLLGSNEAAGCLDCHVSSMQNVHVMKAHGNEAAATNPKQLGDTCRTPTCHPTAGTQLSSAAIHLNLPTSRGVEFFIAVIFVVLIIFTFGPSLLLMTMKLLQIVVDRKDADHEEHVSRVKKLMRHPEGRLKLVRFNPHQRAQHWFLVIMFTVLVVTGFPIKFADERWAAWVIGKLGGLATARTMHRWAGTMLIGGFLYHLAYIAICVIRTKRKTGKSLFKIIFELPMMVRPVDQKFMLDLLLYVLFIRRKRPAGDRFNPEEKFEYIGVFWGTFVLGVTGVLMWANGWTSRHMAGRVLTVASLVHTFEAFLALLHVGIVHMASVIFAPGVFPVSRAMFGGNTPAEEMVEAHSAMVEEVEKSLEGERSAEAEAQHA